MPPGAAVLANAPEFAQRPFGSSGLMLPAAGRDAPPPAPRPLTIPPPDWANDPAAHALARDDPASSGLDALAAIKQAEMGEAYDPPSPIPGPPVVLEPLRRPVLPEPDWLGEQGVRRQRERAEQGKP